MGAFQLRGYRIADAIAGWATSEAEARAWCGRAEPAFDEWHADPDVRPYVLTRDGEPVAYGEIWVEEDGVELGRLIVRPSDRGRGIGRRLVEELVARAPAGVVYLRVLPDNAPALACYRGAGFARVAAAEEERFNRGQSHAYAWLRRRTEPAPDRT